MHSVLRHGPVLLFGVFGGLYSDRTNRLRLLLVTQLLLAAVATTLAVTSTISTPTLALIYSLTLAQGLINAVDNPLRRVFVRDLVDDAELSNAVSLHSTMATVCRTVGPALGGVLIATAGVRWSFTVNALSYVAVIGSLLAIDTRRLRPAQPVKRAKGQLREGFRYAWQRRRIRNTLVMTGIVSIFAWNWHVLIPGLSTSEFDGGASQYGFMVAALSAGSFAGALRTARAERLGGRHLTSSGTVLSAGLLLTAVAPNLPAAIGGLVLVGAAGTSFTIGAQARLQLNTDDQMSGRVMALFSVLFLGSRPIGGLLGGWIMDASGVRAAFATGAVVVASTLVVNSLVNRQHKKDVQQMEETPHLVDGRTSR
jgi:MFS family permease